MKIIHKILFFLISTLFQTNLNAQAFTLHGIITDKTKPLPFSTVEIMSKKKGVISDEFGNFAIDLDKNDTLLIKSLGYKNKYLHSIEATKISISLEADTFILNAVTVIPYKQKTINKGFLNNKPKGGYRSRAGSIIAYHIQLDSSVNQEQFLKEVSIYIANEDVVKTPIRVRCMVSELKTPQFCKDVYKDPVILRPNKGGKWYKIDLSNFNIRILENGVYICFEYFEDSPKYYIENEIKIQNKTKKYISYGNTLGGYWSTEQNRTWHKTIGDKWFQRLEKIEGKTMDIAVKYSILYQ